MHRILRTFQIIYEKPQPKSRAGAQPPGTRKQGFVRPSSRLQPVAITFATTGSEVVSAPSNGAPHGAEQDKNQADHQKDNPDHPQDSDLRDQPNDEKYYAQRDH